jgi:hypothetical protein
VRKPLPQLPIRIRPADHETVTSYIARLATLHGLRYEDLWTCLSAQAARSGSRRLIVLNRLTAVTGHPSTALQRALPELRDPPPDWQQFRPDQQRACPPCAAGHPGGPVRRLFTHHQFLCTRHGYWIGPAEPGMDHQPQRLTTLVPELLDSQRRHDRLVRRHGWHMTHAAVELSISLCVDLHCYGPFGPHNPYQPRLDTLIPTAHTFTGPRYIAAFYPEVVRLAALFCTPRWRAVAERALPAFHRPVDAHGPVPTVDRDAIMAAIGRALGCSPDLIHDDNGMAIRFWLQGMIDARHLIPNKTFPDTRKATLDGTPRGLTDDKRQQLGKALRAFHNDGRVAAWHLPARNIRDARPPQPLPPPLRTEPTRWGTEWIPLDENDIAQLAR